MNKNMQEKISRRIFQSSIGILFGYFGILALIDPDGQAATWITPNVSSLITFMVSLKIFMLILGSMQVVVAALLILDKYYLRPALLAATVLLVGIIINLGWNNIALRDFVILTGVAHLYLQTRTIKAEE